MPWMDEKISSEPAAENRRSEIYMPGYLEVMRSLNSRPFYIYGNGFVAKRFYKCIQKMNLSKQILGIIVTRIIPGDKGIGGKLLCELEAVPRDSFIVIAVHNASFAEIKERLIAFGFFNFIWVYPCLLDMEMGEPIRKDCVMKTEAIIYRFSDIYAPAIYYLSLHDYCSDNIYNGRLYIKFSSHYITREMALKRWARFCRRIDQYVREGYKQDGNIKVNEDDLLLDGFHRVVLAKYFRAETVIADIYAGPDAFYLAEGHDGDILMHERDLPKYYTADEIAAIKAADRELRGIS